MADLSRQKIKQIYLISKLNTSMANEFIILTIRRKCNIVIRPITIITQDRLKYSTKVANIQLK